MKLKEWLPFPFFQVIDTEREGAVCQQVSMIIYTFFCLWTTEQVSCHQRFIGFIMKGAGGQVLGVGDS